MSDERKIVLWFLACLALVLYAKVAGWSLSGPSGNQRVLGSNATKSVERPNFGAILPERR